MIFSRKFNIYVSPKRCQRGVSLIEVMLSLFLISLALVSLTKLHVLMERQSQDIWHRKRALHFAESKLEMFYRAQQMGQVIKNGCETLAGQTDVSFAIAGRAQCLPEYEQGYRIEWQVKEAIFSGSQNLASQNLKLPNAKLQNIELQKIELQKIAITVSWYDRLQQKQSLFLETHLF